MENERWDSEIRDNFIFVYLTFVILGRKARVMRSVHVFEWQQTNRKAYFGYLMEDMRRDGYRLAEDEKQKFVYSKH